MQEEKRKMIVATITREAINPQTKLPHPARRIEIAMEEAKIHVDPFKSVDEQVTETLKAIRTKIPIKFEKVQVAIKDTGGRPGESVQTSNPDRTTKTRNGSVMVHG